MCKVILVGRLGADPELRTSAAGNVWATLSVAADRRVKEGDQWVEKTDWHRIKLFGPVAERAHRNLHRGSMVAIDGTLVQERWKDKDGNDRFGVSIIGRRIEYLADFGARGATPQVQAAVA